MYNYLLNEFSQNKNKYILEKRENSKPKTIANIANVNGSEQIIINDFLDDIDYELNNNQALNVIITGEEKMIELDLMKALEYLTKKNIESHYENQKRSNSAGKAEPTENNNNNLTIENTATTTTYLKKKTTRNGSRGRKPKNPKDSYINLQEDENNNSNTTSNINSHDSNVIDLTLDEEHRKALRSQSIGNKKKRGRKKINKQENEKSEEKEEEKPNDNSEENQKSSENDKDMEIEKANSLEKDLTSSADKEKQKESEDNTNTEENKENENKDEKEKKALKKRGRKSIKDKKEKEKDKEQNSNIVSESTELKANSEDNNNNNNNPNNIEEDEDYIYEQIPQKTQEYLEKIAKTKINLDKFEQEIKDINIKIEELKNNKKSYDEVKAKVDESNSELDNIFNIMKSGLNSLHIFTKITNYDKNIYKSHKSTIIQYQKYYMNIVERIKEQLNSLNQIEEKILNNRKEIRENYERIINLNKEILETINISLKDIVGKKEDNKNISKTNMEEMIKDFQKNVNTINEEINNIEVNKNNNDSDNINVKKAEIEKKDINDEKEESTEPKESAEPNENKDSGEEKEQPVNS